MSPTWSTNFDYSETSAMIFLQERSSDRMPSFLHDAELSDETIGKAPSSPLSTHEQEAPASPWQVYHSFESQSSYVRHGSTVRPVNEISSLGSSSRERASLGMEELQKSHVLKVKELSRRKLTEDFIEVTAFFQSLKVKTVYILGDNNAKLQMLGYAGIDDEHIRNSLASPLYLQQRKNKREAAAGLSLARETACFNVHSQFLASTGNP